MKLPDKAYKQFKYIYLNKTGVVLADREVKAKAHKLINLVIILITEWIELDTSGNYWWSWGFKATRQILRFIKYI
jgi:hypothetical protein